MMHRRKFLQISGLGIVMMQPAVALGQMVLSDDKGSVPSDRYAVDRLLVRADPPEAFVRDICLDRGRMELLESCLDRMDRLQRVVGYANFNLIGFDDAVKYARAYTRIGAFSRQELDFMDDIFHASARAYGFIGQKTSHALTDRIDTGKVLKIPDTGHYLFKGKSCEFYYSIRDQIGGDMVLTSGVRSVIKQFHLFFNKAAQTRGNLSVASRSLAPPGYSFHGTGDFDVGKKGFGMGNFSEAFVHTRVYSRLSSLGYVRFRYSRHNNLGVRFEPWHIEVV